MATITPREGSLSPKEVVRRFSEEVVNKGNYGVLDELVDEILARWGLEDQLGLTQQLRADG